MNLHFAPGNPGTLLGNSKAAYIFWEKIYVMRKIQLFALIIMNRKSYFRYIAIKYLSTHFAVINVVQHFIYKKNAGNI